MYVSPTYQNKYIKNIKQKMINLEKKKAQQREEMEHPKSKKDPGSKRTLEPYLPHHEKSEKKLDLAKLLGPMILRIAQKHLPTRELSPSEKCEDLLKQCNKLEKVGHRQLKSFRKRPKKSLKYRNSMPEYDIVYITPQTLVEET